jgi:hypothetical protein
MYSESRVIIFVFWRWFYFPSGMFDPTYGFAGFGNHLHVIIRPRCWRYFRGT